MTAAQIDALRKAEDLLVEHFDGYVLVVDAAFVDDHNNHEHAGSFSGGIPLAIGLCETQKSKLLQKFLSIEE